MIDGDFSGFTDVRHNERFGPVAVTGLDGLQDGGVLPATLV
jgi:hypothetical protein